MRYGLCSGKRTKYCVDLPHERIPNLEAALVHGYSILDPVSLEVCERGMDSVTDLEVVRNISEVGLVVYSSSAGARLGGSLAT